jgi:hypothetical protein
VPASSLALLLPDTLDNAALSADCCAIACRVIIAARVVCDVLMITFCASRNVTAEGGSPTVLDCGHHLQLGQVQVPCLFTTIGTAMGTENVRDLQF